LRLLLWASSSFLLIAFKRNNLGLKAVASPLVFLAHLPQFETMRTQVISLFLLAVAVAAAPGASDTTLASATSHLQGELQTIRQADAEHTQKLLFIVKLRDALRLRLHTEDEQLGSANNRIATKIADIMHGRPAQTTALLQRGAHRRSARTAEEIAADALKHMQALSELIQEIQQKDDEEVVALSTSARKRAQLSGEMEAQQEALSGDSSTLLSDLGKIRSALLGSAPAQPAAATAVPAQPVAAVATPTENKVEEVPAETKEQAETNDQSE